MTTLNTASDLSIGWQLLETDLLEFVHRKTNSKILILSDEETLKIKEIVLIEC